MTTTTNLTTGGRWIRREQDRHVCPKPTRAQQGPYTVKRGDQWQCAVCHKVYTVTGLNQGPHESLYPAMIEWDDGFTSGVGIHAPVSS